MDDLGAREQFPSGPEVYTMYPPDTPGQPYVCSPDPELAELSTVLKLMGLSNMDEDWVSFLLKYYLEYREYSLIVLVE